MIEKTRKDEKARFVIVNDGCAISFNVDGNTAAALVEAFSWLPVARRVSVLKRITETHEELMAKEAARDATPT